MRQEIQELKKRFSSAISNVFPEQHSDAFLTTATNPSFGDYQVNAPMSLAKKYKESPKEVANKILESVSIDDLCEKPIIAGPGFINLTFRSDWILSRLSRSFEEVKKELNAIGNQNTCVIDFSSPNVAKDMHVGHLRSTIIGDSLAHALSLCGYNVLRRNHVGDWGTQFGMLIAQLYDYFPNALLKPDALDIKDLVSFYKSAKKRFDEDEVFQNRARAEVVKLQSYNSDSIKAWNILCEQSRREFNAIYQLLGIKIEEKGESFYNKFLPEIVSELETKGIAIRHEGALCVFLDQFTNREGNPLPLIIQKSDGAYNYGTTDLAALRYRIKEEKATLILYVIDAGQGQHVSQFIATANKAEWIPKNTTIEHIPFGLVLGADGKKLKTRSGETVKLKELLDEGIQKAKQILEDRTNLSTEEKDYIAKVVGISAIKYADLCQNRNQNYVFNFDKMLSMQGNTAPFLLYSYARICGIIRKLEFENNSQLPYKFSDNLERQLAFMILRFDEIVEEVIITYLPNRIALYLFELCQKFNQFYDKCSVVNSSGATKTLRYNLCVKTGEILKEGLGILGIPTLEKM